MHDPPVGEREVVEHATLYRADRGKPASTATRLLSANDDVADSIPEERHRSGVERRDHGFAALSGCSWTPVDENFEDYRVVAHVQRAALWALPRDEVELVAVV